MKLTNLLCNAYNWLKNRRTIPLLIVLAIMANGCATLTYPGTGPDREQTKTLINSNVEARVYRDGSYIGTTPMEICIPDGLFYKGGGKLTFELLGKDKNKRIHKVVFGGFLYTLGVNLLTPGIGHVVDFTSGAGFWNKGEVSYDFNINKMPLGKEFVYWNPEGRDALSFINDFKILGEARKTYTTYKKPSSNSSNQSTFTTSSKTVIGLRLMRRYKPYEEIGYPKTEIWSVNFASNSLALMKCRWTGNFDKENNATGYGTAYFEDGSYYQGFIKNNKPNGYGVFKFSYPDNYRFKGDQVSGNWVDGNLNGVGIVAYDPLLPGTTNGKYITGEYVNSAPTGTFYLLDANNNPVGKTDAKNGKVLFEVAQPATVTDITDLLIKGTIMAAGLVATVAILNMDEIPSLKLKDEISKMPDIRLDDPVVDSKNCTETRTYYSIKSSENETYRGIYKEKADESDIWRVDKSFYESSAEKFAGVLLVFPLFSNDDPKFYSLIDLKASLTKYINDKRK